MGLATFIHPSHPFPIAHIPIIHASYQELEASTFSQAHP